MQCLVGRFEGKALFSLNKPQVELTRFKIISIDTSSYDGTWKPIWGEVSEIRNRFNQIKICLQDLNKTDIVINLTFVVYNDGLAFRYEFPDQKAFKHFIIKEELTQFTLTADNKTFWIPGDYDTNEYLYNTTFLSEIDAISAANKEKDIAVQSLIGPNAVQTPLMMKSPDNIYINIHEAALINYAAMHLVLDKSSNTFTSHLVPDVIGNKGYLETPAKTPWRTLIISDKAEDILSSKMILNLNEPSKIENTDWIKPQKFILPRQGRLLLPASYNEPNVNVENHQGFANPNQYARAWAAAAREVIANGGLPGIGAFSPGGEYNHYAFLGRTLQALEFNGDGALLNRAWLSVHNYHGTRPYDDPDDFLLFRKYDEIVVSHLGRSLPMIGTEGGSYSPDRNVEVELIRYQYTYMRDAEPYFLAFSYWLLANSAGGAHDRTWEWQALFKPGFVHPAVTEFFYQNSR